MAYPIVNGTGWNELIDGHLISAVYTMYNTAFLGFFVAILFFTYQGLIYIKTRNPVLSLSTGLIFASLYGVSAFVHVNSIKIIVFILVMQTAVTLYLLLTKWFFFLFFYF